MGLGKILVVLSAGSLNIATSSGFSVFLFSNIKEIYIFTSSITNLCDPRYIITFAFPFNRWQVQSNLIDWLSFGAIFIIFHIIFDCFDTGCIGIFTPVTFIHMRIWKYLDVLKLSHYGTIPKLCHKDEAPLQGFETIILYISYTY